MLRVKRAGGITALVDGAGAVVWCDDWAGLWLLALRGHWEVKPRPRGGLVWRG